MRHTLLTHKVLRPRRWSVAIAAVVVTCLCAILQAAGVAPRPFAGGAFEASGVEEVEGTTGVLFVDDGRTREIFYMDLAADGTQRGRVVAVPLPGTDVTDPEGITSHDGWFYIVGSQSKNRGYEGDGLVRFRFDPATRRATDIQRIQGLKRWLAARVAELHGTEARIGDRVLNIEAIAWDPDHQRLLLGLRTPVVNGAALVIPLELLDAKAPLHASNLAVSGGRAIHVPLGGAGIRSLEHKQSTGSFQLITGSAVNDENRDFRLMEWNGLGGAQSNVRELARFPRALKPEGITGGSLNARPADVIVFDTGRFLLFQ